MYGSNDVFVRALAQAHHQDRREAAHRAQVRHRRQDRGRRGGRR